MTDTTTPAPEGAAPTPVPESPTPARAPDGKFTASTPETSATTEPEAAADPSAEPKPDKADKPRSRAAERINQLTAEKNAAMRRAAVAEQRYNELQKAPRPQIDPSDYEAVQRESMRGVIREETAQQTVTEYRQAVQEAKSAQTEAFFAKLDAARERIPDIDASLREFFKLPVSEHAGEIIAESDVAAEIAHYLASNPREAHEIHRMTPAQQGRALARIEARVSLPTRKTSSAPPPPPSVTGSGAPTARTPSEMGIDEMQAMLRKAGTIR